jgi:hypothetical protein
MVDIDDQNKRILRWTNKIELGGEWNDMSVPERKALLIRFKRCALEILDLNISEKELLSLVIDTDQETLWEAIVNLNSWFPVEGREQKTYQLLGLLRKGVYKVWEEKHPILATFQPKDIIRAKENPKLASDEEIKRCNPVNLLGKHCKCGNRLQKNNVTGLCTACQRRGNGYSEH